MENLKSYQEILIMDPDELQDWLLRFVIEIPTTVETVEDMQNASKLLSALASSYAYLNSLAVYAKNAVRREKKKGKENKDIYEALIDRQNAIDTTCDSVKMLYNCLSRLVTIKQEINKEINMSGFIN